VQPRVSISHAGVVVNFKYAPHVPYRQVGFDPQNCDTLKKMKIPHSTKENNLFVANQMD
jgi:hypothetical protein